MATTYIGIDLNDKHAIVSYYQSNMNEPMTTGTIAGSEVLTIPTLLATKKQSSQWFYGDEARKMAKTSEMICIDALLRRAVAGETILIDDQAYESRELLAIFLKKIIEIPMKLGNIAGCDKLILSVDRLSRDNMEVFWSIVPLLGLRPDQFMAIDHKESFYYFALSQDEPLWLHDVYFFSYDNENMHYLGLKRNPRTTPQVVTIKESMRLPLDGNKDEEFLRIIQKAFENKIISSVYLLGEGFEGNWMKNSLTYLCRGRRVFLGNNLFSKGACYAGYVRDHEDTWKCIYMGENEMKFNLSLKIRDKGELAFKTLISAGKNWFETKGQCEVILSGTSEIDFWKQLPNSREAVIETLELNDLPKRPDRTTRLRITVTPIADDAVEVEIKDLGFGEIFKSTEKTWRYTMTM